LMLARYLTLATNVIWPSLGKWPSKYEQVFNSLSFSNALISINNLDRYFFFIYVIVLSYLDLNDVCPFKKSAG
jgi:hypothetical protein